MVVDDDEFNHLAQELADVKAIALRSEASLNRAIAALRRAAELCEEIAEEAGLKKNIGSPKFMA